MLLQPLGTGGMLNKCFHAYVCICVLPCLSRYFLYLSWVRKEKDMLVSYFVVFLWLIHDEIGIKEMFEDIR